MKCKFSIIFVAFYLIVILIAASFFVLSQGNSSPRKVYSTDFESVTKKDRTQLNMGIDNYFDFDGSNLSMFLDNGALRSDSPLPHTGSKDICLEINEGYRNEFNLLNMQSVVGKELFVSAWLYLPSNFQLHMPRDNWLEIADPMFTQGPPYEPYFALMITQESLKPTFSLALCQRDINNVFSTVQKVLNVDLPLGRWFSLQYYVFRDASNGAIKVWFDDPSMDNQPLLNVGGLNMVNPAISNWYTTVAKLYYDSNDNYSPYRLWVDDLNILNFLPKSSLNANT